MEAKLKMSICLSGMTAKIKAEVVSIFIKPDHPLVMLSNSLPWQELAEMAMPDVQKTKKGFWFLGRKLKLRTHLGVYLLQLIHNMTDRDAERFVLDNAAFQLFCGLGSVENWKCPDHTKIEEFRNRLSNETQNAIANFMAQLGVRLGAADPSMLDQDSTVQEANMAYPADANIMVKLVGKAKKFVDWMLPHLGIFQQNFPGKIDFKACKSKLKEYFFSSTRGDIEKKKRIFNELYEVCCKELTKIQQIHLTPQCIERLPWNMRQAWLQIKSNIDSYLAHVSSFMQTGDMVKGKILSLHLNAVTCFNKGKLDKKLHFGRAFQLGRIGGNFLIVTNSETVRMDDKKNVKPMVTLHQKLFGEDTLKSYGTDRGYFSNANDRFLQKQVGLTDTALQKPGFKIESLSEEKKSIYQSLVDRRSGIEPLIGHAKHKGQLGKSRMKSDRTILSSGYGAITGFNARQLIAFLQHQSKTQLKVA